MFSVTPHAHCGIFDIFVFSLHTSTLRVSIIFAHVSCILKHIHDAFTFAFVTNLTLLLSSCSSLPNLQ